MNLKPHGAATFLALALAAAVLAIPLHGCRGDRQARDAIQSDAHGYICPKCGSKFYTESGVFAAKCPDCGNLEIDEVWGHWCDDCGVLTLAPRKAGETIACGTCGKPTSGIDMPDENELIEWGAKKAAREAVDM